MSGSEAAALSVLKKASSNQVRNVLEKHSHTQQSTSRQSTVKSLDQTDGTKTIVSTGGDELQNDCDDTYLANDNDEFHDAVEDVTQFSVTLPRANVASKALHQRNPSNISKIYLQESDDDDEYDNSDNDDENSEKKRTIKVTMQSAAATTSQDISVDTQKSTAGVTNSNQSNASSELLFLYTN